MGVKPAWVADEMAFRKVIRGGPLFPGDLGSDHVQPFPSSRIGPMTMTEITAHRFALRRTALLSGCLATVLAAGALPGLVAAGHASSPPQGGTTPSSGHPAGPSCGPAPVPPAVDGDGDGDGDLSDHASHASVSWRQPLAPSVVGLTLAMSRSDRASGPTATCVPGGGKPAPTPTPTPTPTHPTPTPTPTSPKPTANPTPPADNPKPSADPTPTPSSGVQTPPPSNDNANAPATDPLPAVTTPTAGRTLTVGTAKGSVRVKLRGSDVYVPLSHAATVPMGSAIDARHGTVTLTDVRHTTTLQTATFWGGVFSVAQHKRSHELTEVRLVGRESCPRVGRLRAITASRHHHVRSLWGHDSHGQFSTRGRNAVATVRGTTWLTQDTCAGTRVKVRHGVVSVRDLRRHHTVVVSAGHSYLARTRPRGARA